MIPPQRNWRHYPRPLERVWGSEGMRSEELNGFLKEGVQNKKKKKKESNLGKVFLAKCVRQLMSAQVSVKSVHFSSVELNLFHVSPAKLTSFVFGPTHSIPVRAVWVCSGLHRFYSLDQFCPTDKHNKLSRLRFVSWARSCKSLPFWRGCCCGSQGVLGK